MMKMKMRTIFEIKEAVASINLDNDPDIVTVSEGLTNNPKLYDIGIAIRNKQTDQIAWRGSVAYACRAFSMLENKR